MIVADQVVVVVKAGGTADTQKHAPLLHKCALNYHIVHELEKK